MANVLNEHGEWTRVMPVLATEQDVARIEAKLDRILAFQDELIPFLEIARRYTTGSKTDKLRTVLGYGR
jgi:hypothetical protein